MIKIHNFRAGFATNSSSSHSVVLISDDQIGKLYPNDDGSDDFGWGNFTLTSQESKLRYLAAQLLASGHPDPIPEVKNISGVDFTLNENSYVDHQSVLFFPPAVELAELVKLFMSPNVIVLGGNDNGDDHPYTECTTPEPVIDAISQNNKCLRRDKDYWIVFDHYTGNKVRLSYKENVPEYTKATVPELVDLKITDYCDRGCAFCYQSSTTHGIHAPLERIEGIIRNLKALEVFEVALGGGEPTEHPHFKHIIEEFHDSDSNRIAVNFTTLSDKWLNDAALVRSVSYMVGAIGVSCSSAKGLDLWEKIRTSVRNTKIVAQHVLGSVPLWVTGEFLKTAFERKIPVLLLGYKEVGFGKTYERHDHGDVATFLKLAIEKHTDVELSVDTALVDRFPDLPGALGAPRALVTSPEGKFSCYIDGVANKMAASSYVEPSTMDELPTDPEDIKKLFARY